MSPETRTPRPGEELDLAVLGPYLRAQLDLPADAPIEIQQFPGGHSNLTYLVTVAGRELVLRRPPFGSKVKTAHDMLREAHILSRLAPVWPLAPRPVVVCEDEAILGARFYLMERVPGVILRRDPPRGVTVDAAALGDSFVDALADLHAIDWRAAGLGDFGHPDGYVARQVSGWSKRWVDARTEDLPHMDRAAAWLAANQPESPPATIVHNDFKYDNLVLDAADPTRIIAVLDWEMATIGDPLMDLGTSLCYWVEPGDAPDVLGMRFGPTTLPGSPTRRQLAERYAARTGRDLTHLRFYHAFGLFKTAVVAQQIYYRYAKGLTQDPRFPMFGVAVKVLARQANEVIDSGH